MNKSSLSFKNIFQTEKQRQQLVTSCTDCSEVRSADQIESTQQARCDQPWDAMEGIESVRICPNCNLKVYRADDDQTLLELVKANEDTGKELKIYRRFDGTFMIGPGGCREYSLPVGLGSLTLFVIIYVLAFNSKLWLDNLTNGFIVALPLFLWDKRPQLLRTLILCIVAGSIAGAAFSACVNRFGDIHVSRLVFPLAMLPSVIVFIKRLRKKTRQPASVEKEQAP